MSETVKFRDKLRQETGTVLTVGDTRTALEALECALKKQPIPTDLTSEQQALFQTYVNRQTIF